MKGIEREHVWHQDLSPDLGLNVPQHDAEFEDLRQ